MQDLDTSICWKKKLTQWCRCLDSEFRVYTVVVSSSNTICLLGQEQKTSLNLAIQCLVTLPLQVAQLSQRDRVTP